MKKHIKRTVSILLAILAVTLSLPISSSAFADENENLHLFGDVTGDGVVSLKDASFIQKSELGLEYMLPSMIPIADVSCDGNSTLIDAYIIQQYVVGVDMDYPVNNDGFSIGDYIVVVIDDPVIDSDDTDSVIDDTDSTADSEIEETDSEIEETDTTIIDSEIEETDTTVVDSEIEETDTTIIDTESDILVVEEIPLEQINAQLNGSFENGAEVPDNWERMWDYMYVSSAPGEGVGGSQALKISNPSMMTSFTVSHVKGLKPGADYKYKVMVKADNVQRKTENGLCVDVGTCLNGIYVTGRTEDGNFDRGKGYMMYATETSLDGSFDWKEITVYFVADAYGRADIVLYLDATGTAWFDNVEIDYADFDSEVTAVRRFVGEHTGIIMRSDDIAEYSDEDMYAWVADLDYAYEQEADLMGAVPFYGDKIYFSSSEEMMVLQFQALGAINPLKWNRGYMVSDCKQWCTQRVQSAVPYHEMGHNFDTMYPWSYSSENTADFKAAYVILQKGEGKIEAVSTSAPVDMANYMNFLKSESPTAYDKTLAKRITYNNLNYYDCVPYLMIRTCESVGWDTAKQVFRQFNESYDRSYEKSFAKFFYWLMSLQNKYNETHPDATGWEIYDSFPDGELDYYKETIIRTSGQYGYDENQEIHCVKFLDPDGSRLWFEFVPHGQSVSPKDIPDHEKYGAFTGWDQDVSCVTSDMTVTANYENYVSAGTISASSDGAYEGEFLNVTVNSAVGNDYVCNIVAVRDGDIVYESGYTNSYSAKIFIDKAGDYTVFAMLKCDGGELTTSKMYFRADRAVTVYYSGFNNPNIHYKAENGAWTAVPGKPMTSNSDVSGYAYKYVIPISAEGGTAEICFNDGNNNWDNNGEKNYLISEGAFGIKNGSVTQITG